MINLPYGVKYDRSLCVVVSLESLDVVLEAIWSDGAHVDDEGSPKLSQVGGFLGVVGHDGTGTNGEGHVGGEVLNNLRLRVLGRDIKFVSSVSTHQVGHVVRQGRRLSHGAHNLRHHGDGDLGEQVAGRGSRVLRGDDCADDGDAIEGLRGGPASGDDGAGVGGVDAADAHGRHGAVAGGGEGGEDVADARGADDGFGVFLSGRGGSC